MSAITNQEYSFLELLNEYKVQIPIIQRDYAQGRNSASDIRASFLGSIAVVIQATKEDATTPPLSLDFIYGTAENGVLEPIDGQQRLTTLFLLHWYYAAKEAVLDVEPILKKFTYRTRISSTEFCWKLCENLQIYGSKQVFGSISAAIKDASWFLLSWADDPTVSGMLTMLDEIDRHPVLGKLDQVYSLFAERSPIVFQFLPIEHFGKGEELYIKMNSRGKRLTDYENFKALFGKLLSDQPDLAREYWSNIDGKWNKGFWEYISSRYTRKKVPENQYHYQTDNTILRYLWAQFEMLWAMGHKQSSSPFYTGANNLVFRFELVRDALNKTTALLGMSSKKYVLKALDLSGELLPLLDNMFGTDNDRMQLWDASSIPDALLPMEKKDDGRYIVESKNLSYMQKMLAFSSLAWCVKNDGVPATPADLARLKGYIRIIRNALIRIRALKATQEGTYSPELRFENIGAMLTFITEHLLEDVSLSAYESLLRVDSKVIRDLFPQMEEERQKAVYIMQDTSIETDYHAVEDLSFIRGTISKLLDSSGKLILSATELVELFHNLSEPQSLQLTRAILAVHPGFFLRVNADRRRLGGKADNQWLVGLTYSGSDSTKTALHKFAEKYKLTRTRHSDRDSALQAIIDEYLAVPHSWRNERGEEDWRYYFVKYPTALARFSFSKSDMLRKPNDAMLNAQPIFIWYTQKEFLNRTILNGVRRTRPHVNTYVWIAAQDKRISKFFDAYASWKTGNADPEAVFRKNDVEYLVGVSQQGFILDGKTICADDDNDRVEKLIQAIIAL